MEAASKTMSYSWVWLLSILLFFFNALPFGGGLTLSLLLTPVWLYLLREWNVSVKAGIGVAFTAACFYTIVHFWNGVTPEYYLISSAILIATIIFGIAAYHGIRRNAEQLDAVFRGLLILNFAFTIVSLALLFVPGAKSLVWYTMSISQDIEPMPRLKLFTAEASHYSYLFAPLAIYFLSRLMFNNIERPATLLLFVMLPLVLSFSLGVLLCLTITGAVIFMIYSRQILSTTKRKRIVLIAVGSFALVAVALYFLYPHNPLYQRIANIFSGKDTSARGRTYESFILAHKIIGHKSYLFGIGPGQLKVFGRDIIVQYYIYMKIPDVIRIPNACADTIVCFGYVGLALRLGIQLFLSVKTKVFGNPFRVWLFLFLFLYQFTGSYINNTVEFMLWALLFAPVFPDMNLRNLKTVER